MVDGLPSHLGDIGSESILDASISTGDLADSQVTNAKLGDNACSGGKLSPEVALCYTGSPSYGGQVIQVGTGTLVGSQLWVDFGTAFAAAPTVIATNTAQPSKVINVVAGSLQAGSFFAEGEAETDTFSWIAVGSGRV